MDDLQIDTLCSWCNNPAQGHPVHNMTHGEPDLPACYVHSSMYRDDEDVLWVRSQTTVSRTLRLLELTSG